MTKKKKPTYRQLQESLRMMSEECKGYLSAIAWERKNNSEFASENRRLWKDKTRLQADAATLMCALRNSQIQVEGLSQNNWIAQAPVNEESR